MEFNYTVVVVIASLWIAAGVMLYWGIKKKNKFGVNTSSIKCPQCDLKAPSVRKPKNISEALWGGFTCEKCGAEIDKWGRLKK